MAGSKQKPRLEIDGFGGLNTREHPFDLRPGDFAELVNIDRSIKALRTRKGQERYIITKYRDLGGPIRKLFRYRNAAGTKKILAHDGTFDSLYGDLDDGKFDLISALPPDADGNVWIEQYRETVLAGSDAGDIVAFNPAHTPAALAPKLGPFGFAPASGAFDATPATSGGNLLDKYYLWRVSFDVEIGDDFMGETPPTVSVAAADYASFEKRDADWTGGAGNDNMMTFLRPSDAIVNALPTYLKRIHFYRSVPLDAQPWPADTFSDRIDVFRVGTVDMATVRAASAGASIFVDDGSAALDVQADYHIRWYPPRGRYALMHKGRLRILNAKLSENVVPAAYTQLEPNKMYSSRFFSNQEEPLSFQPAAPAASFGPWSGEGLTGGASWRGKILLVFTPSSTNAVIGGDDFISETIENLQNEVLSATVGCIAPRSIVQARGAVVWLSHEGIQVFDGRGPYEISDNDVRAVLDAIPAGKLRDAHAYYDSADSEYVLFVCDPLYPDHPRVALRYSFEKKLWTTDRRKRGVGSALEIRESDQQPKVLLGYDDLTSYFAEQTGEAIIVTAKVGFTEGFSAISGDSPEIEWRARTGFFSAGDTFSDLKILDVTCVGEWSEPFTVDVLVDGLIDTEAAGTGMTFDPPPGGSGMVTAEPKNDLMLKGRLIAFILRGANDTSQTYITKIIVRLDVGVERKEEGLS